MCTTCGCSPDTHVTITPAKTRTQFDPQAIFERAGERRTIRLEHDVLTKNNSVASQNRAWLNARNIRSLNLMSSPGSGKTTLLERTITDLKDRVHFSVIEGDQATTNDAERIRATGCNVVQINTGAGCHLDSDMMRQGLLRLSPPSDSVVMIENVGNLVCPALFDLGEEAKVVILSVTEGDDKPVKYPHMFRAANLLVINKIDLLPYVSFDLQRCISYAQVINPEIRTLGLSATRGTGLAHWYEFVLSLSRKGMVEPANASPGSRSA